jgi:NADH dehydrogenase
MTSKNILITGGAGTIGSLLVARFAAQGHRLRVLTLPGDRGGEAIEKMGAEVIYGDISDPETVNGLCEGIDVVLHLAAVIITDTTDEFDRVNVMGTRYLLTDAASHHVRHFIHVSSASVVYRKITPYSRSKRIAERYVRQSELPWTIIRPTLVYGERGGLEFDMFLKYLLAWPVLPFIGAGQALKRPVYAGDLADGFEKVVMLDGGQKKIYNFSGGSAISMLDFARLCLTLLGREDKPIVRIPVIVCTLAAELMKRTMKQPLLKWNMIAGVIQDANLDPSDAVRDLGYRPHAVEVKLKDCFPRCN